MSIEKELNQITYSLSQVQTRILVNFEQKQALEEQHKALMKDQTGLIKEYTSLKVNQGINQEEL